MAPERAGCIDYEYMHRGWLWKGTDDHFLENVPWEVLNLEKNHRLVTFHFLLRKRSALCPSQYTYIDLIYFFNIYVVHNYVLNNTFKSRKHSFSFENEKPFHHLTFQKTTSTILFSKFTDYAIINND